MFVLSCIVFTSCSEDDTVYSCNDTVNSWVKDNKSQISQMTRVDWLRTNAEMSIPIYRAFTSKQRENFWIEKLNEVKQLPWTSEEIEHIRKVEQFIVEHPYVLSGKSLTDNQLDELESFFYQWKNDAMQKLNWKPEVCIAIAGSGYIMKNTKGEVILLSSKESDKMSHRAESSCHCNTSVLSDFCFNSPGPCESSSCESSSVGCGWLLAQSCNGRCGGI